MEGYIFLLETTFPSSLFLNYRYRNIQFRHTEVLKTNTFQIDYIKDRTGNY